MQQRLNDRAAFWGMDSGGPKKRGCAAVMRPFGKITLTTNFC